MKNYIINNTKQKRYAAPQKADGVTKDRKRQNLSFFGLIQHFFRKIWKGAPKTLTHFTKERSFDFQQLKNYKNGTVFYSVWEAVDTAEE